MGPDDLPIDATSVVIPAAQLRWRFSRASGPGGQGVNTTDSRVELVFDLATSPSVPEPLRRRALARLRGRLAGGELVVVAAECALYGKMKNLKTTGIVPNKNQRRHLEMMVSTWKNM
jgi:hypothetical protein